MSKLNKYLNEVKQRCDAATEGPWWTDGTSYVWKDNGMISDTPENGCITRARGTGSGLTCEEQSSNLELIAHAREDVEALRNMVQQLHAERAHLAKYIVELTGNPVPVWKVENLIPKEMRDEC